MYNLANTVLNIDSWIRCGYEKDGCIHEDVDRVDCGNNNN